MKPMVSVITISYNAAKEIGKTIESVLAQTFTDYEYVFIDGNSGDDTLAAIESYRAQFESRGIGYRVSSEPDKGIYDAMNKGVRAARGKWVLMLNAGDRLVDERVLADVFSEEQAAADIVYGDAVLQDENHYAIAKAQPLETITQGMPLCHQCVFVKQEVLVQYGFDLRYRLAADYHQLLRCYVDGKVFRYVPRLISVYDVSGVSERNFSATLAEQKAAGQSLGFQTQKASVVKLLVRKAARLMRWLLPGWSRGESRGWYPSLEKAKSQYEKE